MNSYYEFMTYLYQNPDFLNYLRLHPKWYKILYYERNYDDFIKVVKEELKLRMTDKLESLKRNINLVSSLSSYLDK